jgi:hypothetical protein
MIPEESPTMETQKSNRQIQAEVREELAREPSVDPDAIGITADHGLVFLSGHVLGVTQRRSATAAALRVDGIRAVIDELKIRPGRWGAHDADLACVAADSLRQLIGLPDGRVKVIVRDGKVRLKGAVSSPDEKALIAATVLGAIGRNGALENAISVEPRAFTTLAPDHALTMPPPDGAYVAMPDPGGPRVEDSVQETSTIIVAGESFTNEGIPIRHAHHREYPEIRGEGETSLQSVIRLAHQLGRAREHAREAWQREDIEHAIRDVKDYHSRLMSETPADEAMAGPDDVQENHNQVDLPPLCAAVR